MVTKEDMNSGTFVDGERYKHAHTANTGTTSHTISNRKTRQSEPRHSGKERDHAQPRSSRAMFGERKGCRSRV